MLPVEGDEAQSYLACCQWQRIAVIGTKFYGQVGYCDEQCEFVGGGEVTFGKYPLQFAQKLQLCLGTWTGSSQGQ